MRSSPLRLPAPCAGRLRGAAPRAPQTCCLPWPLFHSPIARGAPVPPRPGLRLTCPLLTQLRPSRAPLLPEGSLPASSQLALRAPPAVCPRLLCSGPRPLASFTQRRLPVFSPHTPLWVRSPFPPPPAKRISSSTLLDLAEARTQSPAPAPVAGTLRARLTGYPGPPGSACGPEPRQLLTGPDLEIIFGEIQASLSSPGGPRSQTPVFL